MKAITCAVVVFAAACSASSKKCVVSTDCASLPGTFCNAGTCEKLGGSSGSTGSVSSTSPTITSVTIDATTATFTAVGTNLSGVTSAQVSGGNLSSPVTLSIKGTPSATQVVAIASSALQMALGGAYSFMVSTANATASVNITYTLNTKPSGLYDASTNTLDLSSLSGGGGGGGATFAEIALTPYISPINNVFSCTSVSDTDTTCATGTTVNGIINNSAKLTTTLGTPADSAYANYLFPLPHGALLTGSPKWVLRATALLVGATATESITLTPYMLCSTSSVAIFNFQHGSPSTISSTTIKAAGTATQFEYAYINMDISSLVTKAASTTGTPPTDQICGIAVTYGPSSGTPGDVQLFGASLRYDLDPSITD